jgi:hypothetical protein
VGELASRPNEQPVIEVIDGGAGYRALVGDLKWQLAEEGEGVAEAASLIRGLVHRITVLPGGDDEPQPIEIEAGPSMNMRNPDEYCNFGCGARLSLCSPGRGSSSRRELLHP